MPDLMRYASELADEIGARPANTQEEQQAAQRIAAWFKKRNLEASIEEFNCPNDVTWPYMVFFALSVIAAGLAFLHGIAGIIGLVLAVIAMGCFIFERYFNSFFGNLFKRGISQNVIAHYAPNVVANEGRRRKIIIVCNYDTPHASPEASPAFVNSKPLFNKIILIAMILIPVLLVVQLLPFVKGTLLLIFWIATCVFALVPLIGLIGLLLRRFLLRYPSGANDNASGVAAMMGVFERVVPKDASQTYFAREGSAIKTHSPRDAYERGAVDSKVRLSYASGEEDSSFATNNGGFSLKQNDSPIRDNLPASITMPPVSSVAKEAVTNTPIIPPVAPKTTETGRQERYNNGVKAQKREPFTPTVSSEEGVPNTPRERAKASAAKAPSWWVQVENKRKNALDEEDAAEVLKARSRYADLPISNSQNNAEPTEESVVQQEIHKVEQSFQPDESLGSTVMLQALEASQPSSQDEGAMLGTDSPGAFVSAPSSEYEQAYPSNPAPVPAPAAEKVQAAATQASQRANFERKRVLSNLPSIEGGNSFEGLNTMADGRITTGSPYNSSSNIPEVNRNLNEAIRGAYQPAPVEFDYENTIQAGPSGQVKSQESGAFVSASSLGGNEGFSPLAAGSFAAGETGAFIPVGDTGTFDSSKLSGQDIFIEDADDSFMASSTRVNDFDRPVSIEMPSSRAHKLLDGVGSLFSRDKRKRKKDNEISSSEWLGVDDSYNATQVGRDIGSWDRFDENEWKGGGARVSNMGGYADDSQEIREEITSLTKTDLFDKDIWFVAFGANNVDNAGVKAFINTHSKDLHGSLIINLQCVGAGELCYLSKEGRPLHSMVSDQRLQTVASKAAKTLGYDIVPERLTWLSTNATPLIRAGFRAITLMSFDRVAPMAWHHKSDTTDIIDEGSLEEAAEIVTQMVKNC